MTTFACKASKQMVFVAGLGRRWVITCACGSTTNQRLDFDEAKALYKLHGGAW